MAKSESESSSSSSGSSSSDSDSSSSDEQAPVEDETSETRGTSSAGKNDGGDASAKQPTKQKASSSSTSSSSSSSSPSSSFSSDSDEDVLRAKIIKLKAELKDAAANDPSSVKTEEEVIEVDKETAGDKKEANVIGEIREAEPVPEKVAQEKEAAAATVPEPSDDAKPTDSKVVEPPPNTSQNPSEAETMPEKVDTSKPFSEIQKPSAESNEKNKSDEKAAEPKEAEAKPSSSQNEKKAPDEDAPVQKKRRTDAVSENSASVSANKEPPKTKEAAKPKSSKDLSRSPDRRERRRSRERDDRYRRQRSISRSRDHRRRRSRSRSRSKDRARERSSDRRRRRSPQKPNDDSKDSTNPNEKITERQRRTVDLLTSRTGGAYIPPAKLRMMQAEITDKASAAYQRIAWEALKKSIHGYINKVNVDNIGIITRELLKENIVRGRGLLCRSIIQAQAASPTFTHVYAALVAIINSKFPNIGELLLKRLVIQFKRAFRRNDKAICLSASRFIAHLVNQRVAHEILALEILTLLVETPTDDSVEVAIAFLKECGMKLTEVSSKGIGAIFEMLKNILHEGKLDKRVQYMIEVVFQVRKDGFKDHQSVIEALELVEEDDQFTHLLMLDEATTTEDNLNAFKFDDKYETNEDKYKGLSKEILGSDASDSDDDDSGSGSDESGSEEDDEEKARADAIIDNTETNLVALRRTIYLTINSSLDYEECAHKLMKMQLKPGQEIELCHMFLDCCAEQRTYEKFYGLLAQRFCSINKTYIEPFEDIFKDTYQTTHRLDTNRLRNVSKFFAHLLFTDAIGWDVIECIKLNEDDTTSSSRIFIKILFQELAEYMGLGKLNGKLKDEVLTESLAGLFPKDNPRNTRFAINFFTSIGLGGLTDDLRQFLKSAPKNVPAINSELLPEKIEISSSSSSTSSSSPSSATSSSPSSPSNSEVSSEQSSSEDGKRKGKKKKNSVKKKIIEKGKKHNSKSKLKKKKTKKKHETSSSESASSESTSSSSNTSSDSSTETSSSDSSSEDEKQKKKKRSSKKVLKKKATRDNKKESTTKKKDKVKKRDPVETKVSNGKPKAIRERDKTKRDQEEKIPQERSRRRENRADRSPNRDRRHRDSYNQSGKKRVRDHRSSRNGSKERG